MTKTRRLLEVLKPLTPLEQAFKYLHQVGVSPNDLTELPPEVAQILRSSPSDEAEFWNIRATELADVLEEEIFFAQGMDIFLNIHPRYMPACLHTHKFFELQFVLAGSPMQTIGGTNLEMEAGDVCFMAPGTWHTPLVFDDDTLLVNILIRRETFRSTFIGLLGDNDIIADFFIRVLYCNSFYPYMMCRSCGDDRLSSVILDVVNISRENRKYKNRLLMVKLEEFFIYLLRDHECDFVVASACSAGHKNIVGMLSYIRRNFRTVTLSSMARFFNYNEAHLSRVIRSYTGSTFSQIVKTIKLQHALNLLEGSSMAISEVIFEAGYEDKSHFYKEFKRRFGVTPAEYRLRKKRVRGKGIGVQSVTLPEGREQ